jgi:hypothetical protein
MSDMDIKFIGAIHGPQQTISAGNIPLPPRPEVYTARNPHET